MRRVRFISSTGISRTTAALAGAALVLTAAPAQGATAQATSSATWLNSQLSAGLVQSEYQDAQGAWQSYTDHGLALDFFFAFDRLGLRPAKQAAILEAMEPEARSYTDPGGTYAGAVGKLLSAVQTEGLDPDAYAGGYLLPRLEELTVDAGPEAGRAKDDTAWADSSNSFGQSYVVSALTRAGSDEAPAATRFLLKQQCSDGFFREKMGTGPFTCDTGGAAESRPDIDATATAAIALRELVAELDGPLQDRVRRATIRATHWLLDRQSDSGSFEGGRNANSTGLAATALSVAGRDSAARRAAQWVNRLRVTPAMAASTALRDGDIGAVAFSPAALNQAKDDGIRRGVRYEWRRATSQAAPALDAL